MDKKIYALIFLLIFNIILFIPQVKAGTGTFGNTSVGTHSFGIKNQVVGSSFTCPVNATTNSIHAYLTDDGTGYNQSVKAAVYLDSDNTLVDNSTEQTFDDAGWYTFTLNGEALIQNEDYVLVVWGEIDGGGGETLSIKAVTPSSSSTLFDAETYGVNWPNPATFTPTANYEASIYLTYTEAGEYNYRFHGLYDENTGYYKDVGDRAVNVTAHWNDGTASQTFEVNGTEYKFFDSAPQYFVFELGAVDREYWVSEDEGDQTTVDIYIFTDTPTAYTISFYDWIDSLSTYSWISAGRYINGTLYTMDKRKVDEQKKVVMALQSGKTYVIKAEATSGSPYTWGDLTMTSDTTVELTVKGLEFPQNVILSYRYIRAYGYREDNNGTHHDIVAFYQDTKYNTNSVNISIYNGSDTLIHSYLYSSTDNFTYTWSNAVANTSYYMVQTISHGDYGTMIFKIPLTGSMNMSNPLDFSFLGTLPNNVSVSSLIPAILLIVIALVFSPLTASIGGVVIVVFAGLFAWWDWIVIDVNVLVFGGVLAVIFAIASQYRRGGLG